MGAEPMKTNGVMYLFSTLIFHHWWKLIFKLCIYFVRLFSTFGTKLLLQGEILLTLQEFTVILLSENFDFFFIF